MKLTIEALTKSYGTNLALDRFSAVLEPGIYALLGPNGSGKSTLMNVITDNLRPDSGRILYTSDNGETRDAREMGLEFRARLGFMPQYPGLYPSFTVARFMRYMAALKGLSRAEAERQIPELLAAVELDDVTGRKIGALSGGMKQRLALAQAVLGEPEILILDEPTAGLDPKQRIAIRNFIAKISFNKIIIIATHVVPDIEFIAHEAILLRRGVIVDAAPPSELTRKLVGRVFLVRCAESELLELQRRYRVTAITRDERSGEAILRVLADEPPELACEPTAPTLEDCYLDIFGEA